MPVGFDSSTLSVLLNPKARIPADPKTGIVPSYPRERLQTLVGELQKEREKIPVTAEILTVVGPTFANYLQIINKSRVFEVRAFDEIAAFELAFMNRDIFGDEDKKNNLEPWQKIKVDRQILAICRVAKCETFYTDDKSLINLAERCGIKTVRLCDLPIPDSLRQGELELERHEELPEVDDEDIEGDPAAGNAESSDKSPV